MAKPECERPTEQPQPAPSAIVSDAIYRADEVKARLGWRDAAFRAARRRGLKVHRCGKHYYATGVDIIAFITKGAAR